jgi:hypothetical protein
MFLVAITAEGVLTKGTRFYRTVRKKNLDLRGNIPFRQDIYRFEKCVGRRYSQNDEFSKWIALLNNNRPTLQT